MTTLSLILDPLDPDMPGALRADLQTYLLAKLGAKGSDSSNPAVVGSQAPTVALASSAGRTGPVDLTVKDAERFLENCSPKTISVLKQIVARDGRFLLPDIAAALRVGQGALGGVWGGLTKRTRTITKEPDASLIDWKWTGGKWQGRLSPGTTVALEKALQNY